MFRILVERELPRPIAESDPMAQLWDAWDAGRGGAALLRRDAFDGFAFPALLGRINLVTVQPGPPTRFRFRLFGSGMDDAFEADMTDREVSDICEPNYADMVQRNYLQCVRLRRPFFAEIKVDIGDDSLFHYCRLILPMTSGTGVFDMLLVASARYADDCQKERRPGSRRIGQSGAFRYNGITPDAVHRWREPREAWT